MVTLFQLDVSNFCSPIKIALLYKGVPFKTLPPPGGYGSKEYKEVVPMGTIPAVLLEDVSPAKVVSESAVILEFLEDRYKEPSLFFNLPYEDSAVRFVHRFHDLYLEPPLRKLFTHMDPRLREARAVSLALDAFLSRLHFLEAYVGSFHEACMREGRVKDPHGRPFLLGTSMTLADCILPHTLLLADIMHCELKGQAVDYGDMHHLAAWRREISEHACVAPVLDAARAATHLWIERKRKGATSACKL